jgi:hypothetical protein
MPKRLGYATSMGGGPSQSSESSQQVVGIWHGPPGTEVRTNGQRLVRLNAYPER